MARPERGVLERFRASIPEPLGQTLGWLLDGPQLEPAEARERVRARLARVEVLAKTRGLVDCESARSLARRCTALLDAVDGEPDGERRLLVDAAVRYFLLEGDADADTGSARGFDDDALVVDLVERLLAD